MVMYKSNKVLNGKKNIFLLSKADLNNTQIVGDLSSILQSPKLYFDKSKARIFCLSGIKVGFDR